MYVAALGDYNNYLTSCLSLHLFRWSVLPQLSKDITLIIGYRRCVSGVIYLATYLHRLYSGSSLWVSNITWYIANWQFYMQEVSQKQPYTSYAYMPWPPLSQRVSFDISSVDSKLMISFPCRLCVLCFDQMIENITFVETYRMWVLDTKNQLVTSVTF